MMATEINGGEGSAMEVASAELLNNHLSTHIPRSSPKLSPTCGQACRSRKDFEIHLRTHTGEKPFKCSTCSKGFARKHDLETHCRLHTGETPFKCDSCHMAFRLPVYLRAHKARAHVKGSEEERKVEPKAEDQMPSETLKTSPEENDGPEIGLEVNVDQEFHLKELIIPHGLGVPLRTHTGEKVATCAICGNGFTSVKNLEAHMRKFHTGERPHRCSTCPKKFASARLLKEHLRRNHLIVKPEKCPMCGQGCNSRGDLAIHLRTHTGEKPFKCTTCSRDFARKHDLRIHSRIHTGEAPFKCDSCHMAFRQSRTLRTHKVRAHMEGNEVKVETKTENQVPIEPQSISTEESNNPENGLQFYF